MLTGIIDLQTNGLSTVPIIFCSLSRDNSTFNQSKKKNSYFAKVSSVFKYESEKKGKER